MSAGLSAPESMARAAGNALTDIARTFGLVTGRSAGFANSGEKPARRSVLQRPLLLVASSFFSGAVEQPLQILSFFVSLASSARSAASCCSSSPFVLGQANACRSPFVCAVTTTSFFRRAGGCLGVSSGRGSFSPSHATGETAVGALQPVPKAQQPVRAMAVKTQAMDFENISIPASNNVSLFNISYSLGHE